MRNAKKCVLSVMVAGALALTAAVTAWAIDTPWLPVEPDTTTAEEPSSQPEPTPDTSTEATNEAPEGGNNTPEATQTSAEGADSKPTSAETTKEPETQAQTKDTMATEPSGEGCNGSVAGFGWLAMIGGAWMLCEVRHAKEKEVNE